MKLKKLGMMLVFVLVAVSMVTSLVAAEDGLLFRKNISKTPEMETEKAALFMMDFYVPAQSSAGIVGPVDNYILDDDLGSVAYDLRNYAKPLVSVYIDGHADISFYDDSSFDDAATGGIVFGAFDAYAGISMDDGTTWKTTNLSKTADLSSFNLANGTAYPGHVHNVVHQVFNDNIMVAYVSKYCEGGTPLYSLDATEYATYLTDLEETYSKDAVYLYDLFGVAGNQGSVNYAEQGWPDVGEIPYSCVWTVRGKLLAGDDPATAEAEATYVMWQKPERLTSGVRDANLPAVDCAAGAGCMLTWQEDPEGLRPGQGLGPGEGWSGAVAWQQTDIWYSHITEAEFDLVFSAEDVVDGGITMADYALLTDATMPKPYVPMAVPVRLTDNAMCKAANSDPYCYIDFDNIDAIDPLALPTVPTADSDFCATQVAWTNPGGTTLNLCVTEDLRLLNGRVASTRVRMNLKPYTPADAVDLDGDGVVEKSAWIVMAAEESKALGDTAETEDTEPVDIGKDMWYYSFDPFKTGADEFMVSQGGMLNQPAVCSEHDLEQGATCTVGEFFPVQTDDREYEYYLTEIARRFALTTNSVQAAVDSESGLSAMLIYKQGIINQGGPADIMLRRTVIDDTVFDPAVDNPYAFENMECDEWVYDDGSNPNYLQGVCLSPAINISGTTIVECDGATGNDACADIFPVNDDGSIPTDEASFPKVLEWRQCDGVASIEGCEDDSDLDDQTWENPFDISKGHRGFLDGDYVMMMYAWSPNWKSNSVGNDHYNLYARRSFDGGLTWTTTPGALGGLGVTATENYCVETASADCVGTEFTYAAGAFEQGRNVSQLIGNKITILDPRYSPTGGLKLFPTISTWFIDEYGLNTYGDTLPYEDDAVRDPSKFFMIYETGDNTTSAVGEATPLNLYYSRATIYGDVWELDPDWYDEETGLIEDYRWNWVENDKEDLSGEASMLVNPGGTFMYAVWNQWREEIKTTVDEYGIVHEEEIVYDSDMIFRRFLYLPDDVAAISSYVPKAWIIYVNDYAFSWTTDDDIEIFGTAVDFDDDEIVEYVWTYYGPDGKVQVIGDNSKILQTSVKNLPGWAQTPGQPGWAKFGLKVKDSDGYWSKEVKVDVLIAEAITRIYNPMVLK